MLHWLGITRIDRLVSMSNMKHDALRRPGHRDRRARADPGRPDSRRCPRRDGCQEGRRLLRRRRARRATSARRSVARSTSERAPLRTACGDVALDAARASRRCSRRRGARALRAWCGRLRRPTAARRISRVDREPAATAVAADVGRRHARGAIPICEIPFHSRWRHFVGRRHRSLARPRGARRRRCRCERARRRSISRSSACCSMPAPAPAWRYRERATGARLRALRGLGRGELRACSPPVRFRRDRRTSAARRCRARSRHRRDDAGAAFPGRRRTIRWSGSRAAPRCCAGSATRSPTRRISSATAGAARRPVRLRLSRIGEQRVCAPAASWPPLLTPSSADLAVRPGCWTASRSATAGGIPACAPADATDRIVPFHKLSQWLAYSLIEPLEEAGVAVTRIDELTGLPEYRNGGLLVDLGVIRPRAAIDPRRAA